MPDTSTPTSRIDSVVDDLVERIAQLRVCAEQCRTQADRFDDDADALRREVDDWNDIRMAAMGVTLVPVLGATAARL